MMSQEFYLKTQALHEEFQKRELYYLNTEVKLRNNILLKKELNLPLQEYLQKIDQKEKESEAAYRNIMKQMEELDRRTDLMSSKLDKLGILRNSLTSFTLPNLPSNARSCLQMYDSTQGFNSNSSIHLYESLEQNLQPISQTNLKSISTQTENIYCVKCHSAIINEPKHLAEREHPLFLNNDSRINIEPQATYLTKSQKTLCTLNEVVNNSQFISSKNNEHSANSNKNFSVENSEMEQHKNEKSSTENCHSDMLLSKRHCLEENYVESNVNNENIQHESLKNIEETTKLHNSGKDDNEFKSPNVEVNEGDTFINVEDTFINSEDAFINVDTFTSKSDAESVNNEFDFLETDKRVVSSKMKALDNSKSNTKSPSSDADVNLDKEASLVVEYSNNPPLKHKKDKAFHPNLKLDVSDNKSETSGSVSAPHSPNVSVGSDSDSISEKGSSLTASAAYQALLGNSTNIPKTKRDNSDSESEDEVENAFANVVQKSNVKGNFIQTAEAKNEKFSSQAADCKPTVKKSKPPSLNKPQDRLSKNTRKVLGLDTSSGSDVELVVKPEKKIEEDSDEFGFYD